MVGAGGPCGAEEGEGAQEVEGEAEEGDLVAGDDKAPQSTPKVNNSDQTHFLSMRIHWPNTEQSAHFMTLA